MHCNFSGTSGQHMHSHHFADGQMPQESQGGEGIISTGSSSMEITTMVPSPVGATDRQQKVSDV